MSGEKPRYRVLRLSHIHNTLWQEGAEIEYEGEPVAHWNLLTMQPDRQKQR